MKIQDCNNGYIKLTKKIDKLKKGDIFKVRVYRSEVELKPPPCGMCGFSVTVTIKKPEAFNDFEWLGRDRPKELDIPSEYAYYKPEKVEALKIVLAGVCEKAKISQDKMYKLLNMAAKQVSEAMKKGGTDYGQHGAYNDPGRAYMRDSGFSGDIEKAIPKRNAANFH